MKSTRPKVLHEVGGRPMIDWSIALARSVGCERIICVVGQGAEEVSGHVRVELGENSLAVQDPPLGTGHAVQAAADELADFTGDVIVLYGDSPLIPAAAVDDLFAALDRGADIGVLGFRAAEPGQYGRLVCNADGDLDAIVEAREASEAILALDLCNSGVLAASRDKLFGLLSRVTNENAKGEYYLTDIVGLSRHDGGRAVVVECNERDVLGVNSRTELAAAEAAFQERARVAAMEAGVTLRDPTTVYFSHDTVVHADVVVEPHVIFGRGVEVASGVVIRGYCHLEHSRISPGASIGPFARLRGGCDVEEQARIGTFVEMKATRMGPGAKANHLAYLGDGTVGAGVNIGAGVIFCNYDGFDKHATVIGDGAFVGSNSALVAPADVGEGAYIGSGSVITRPVPAGGLSVARGRQRDIDGWADRKRAEKAAE